MHFVNVSCGSFTAVHPPCSTE